MRSSLGQEQHPAAVAGSQQGPLPQRHGCATPTFDLSVAEGRGYNDGMSEVQTLINEHHLTFDEARHELMKNQMATFGNIDVETGLPLDDKLFSFERFAAGASPPQSVGGRGGHGQEPGSSSRRSSESLHLIGRSSPDGHTRGNVGDNASADDASAATSASSSLGQFVSAAFANLTEKIAGSADARRDHEAGGVELDRYPTREPPPRRKRNSAGGIRNGSVSMQNLVLRRDLSSRGSARQLRPAQPQRQQFFLGGALPAVIGGPVMLNYGNYSSSTSARRDDIDFEDADREHDSSDCDRERTYEMDGGAEAADSSHFGDGSTSTRNQDDLLILQQLRPSAFVGFVQKKTKTVSRLALCVFLAVTLLLAGMALYSDWSVKELIMWSGNANLGGRGSETDSWAAILFGFGGPSSSSSQDMKEPTASSLPASEAAHGEVEARGSDGPGAAGQETRPPPSRDPLEDSAPSAGEASSSFGEASLSLGGAAPGIGGSVGNKYGR